LLDYFRPRDRDQDWREASFGTRALHFRMVERLRGSLPFGDQKIHYAVRIIEECLKDP